MQHASGKDGTWRVHLSEWCNLGVESGGGQAVLDPSLHREWVQGREVHAWRAQSRL